MEFPAGFCLSGSEGAGNSRFALISAPGGMSVAAVFTTNKCPAHPVEFSRKNLEASKTHKIIFVNKGSANAATGPEGLKLLENLSKKISGMTGVRPEEILFASTGVIGRLPEFSDNDIENIIKRKDLVEPLLFADSIMTTDTCRKTAWASFDIGGRKTVITGIAKGSGMIAPNMATMLGFIMTDACISRQALQKALPEAVEKSFNCLSVDGETSTNDTVFLASSGAAGNREIGPKGRNYEKFQRHLEKVCTILTEQLAADGEGATKLIKVNVKGARSREEAKKAAKTISESPLCKTAFYGASPNWGRIISAIGASGIPVDIEAFSLYANGVPWVKNGSPHEDTWEQVKKVLAGGRYKLDIDLGMGDSCAVYYTCDYSPEYIRINAHYLS